ncbi:MAG: biotin--[acetyl-CoA-carboxylase] ligase [Lachnospiraceae bacterium]|nr:biotin--[acetyl-CoA-carboxylase] ligase [Lachnospiraceae bacterium]
MLSRENLLEKMDTERIGRNVLYLYETDSTNEYAKKAALDSPDGTLVVADSQVKGKGRLGKSWSSPHGKAIFMSIILKEHIIPENASMITIVAAIAVLKAIEGITKDAAVKWPNDIVINGKKICGILTEMKSSGMNSQYVVVGIGINVNNTEFPKEIADVAASLYTETGICYDRTEIICRVMKEFEKYYNIFLRDNDLSEIVKDYNRNLININNQVDIISEDNVYRAESKGIDERGRLIVKRCDTGVIEKIVSGEVSVRGVYGYV